MADEVWCSERGRLMSTERTQTEKIAKCASCGAQWQIRSFAEPPTDAMGCQACGAGPRAITIISERKDFSGALVR